MNRISNEYKSSGLSSTLYRTEQSTVEKSDNKKAGKNASALKNDMKDPYALASTGGILNIKDVDKIAQHAVRDKLDELRKEWELNHAGK